MEEFWQLIRTPLFEDSTPSREEFMRTRFGYSTPSEFIRYLSESRFYEVEVENLTLSEKPWKLPKFSVTYGDEVHELQKCREKIVLCNVVEGIDFLEVALWSGSSYRYTPDDLIGSAKVQLHKVTSKNVHHFTTPLFSNNGRLVGVVQLKIRLLEYSDIGSAIEGKTISESGKTIFVNDTMYEVRVDNLKLFEETNKKPKIIIRYGNAVHAIKECRGQVSSKYFQETFQCKVVEGIDFLEVGLWDGHRFTPDELVGNAKVPLQNVTSENFHPFTTQLFSDSGRLVGEVQLKIRLVEMLHSMPLLPSVSLTRPSVLPDGLPDLRGTEIPSARIRARMGDLLEFNLEGCNTLLKEIDPYISMKYGDVVYKTEKSKDGVVLKEFQDRFVCKADDAIKVLDVDLWKRHRIIPDELVASAKIELDSVTSGAFRHIPTQLFSKDGRYVGEVGLKVRRVKPSDVNHPLKSYKRGNFLNCTKQ